MLFRSVLKTVDTKCIPQSCHELLQELVDGIMLEGSADPDSGKETTSSSSDPSISTPDLLEVQRTAEVANEVVDHVVDFVSAALFKTSGCNSFSKSSIFKTFSQYYLIYWCLVVQ